MYNALVIGCGNIGALYDLKSKNIYSHAKAYYKNKKFKLSVYDADPSKAEKIADLYKAGLLTDLKNETLEKFDFISICTPTVSHFTLLQKLMRLGTRIIICEKPLSLSIVELNRLKRDYQHHKSKVMVNYFRRFLPIYKDIKEYLENKAGEDFPIEIVVKYSRGFLNNASHAMDTLDYLLNTGITLKNVKTCCSIYDAFKNDPTVTCHLTFKEAKIDIIGITGIQYPVFEIEIYYKDAKLLIRESGNRIGFYGATNPKPKKIWKNAMDNYMSHVVKHAIGIYENRLEDNFIHSLEQNKNLLLVEK